MTSVVAAEREVLRLSPDTELTPAWVEAVAVNHTPVSLDSTATAAIEACARALDAARARRDVIYGLTTGFGPLAGHFIDGADAEELQKNLVYHLASGTGDPLEPAHVRAMMVCRAAVLARGHSAVRRSTVELLLRWINEDVVAAVPRYGTVGASGDLTPMAHLVLAMTGEGEVLVEGQRLEAAAVLQRRQIPVLKLDDRDGLAIVNGTAAMTAMAALAHQRGRRALERAVGLGALFAECMGAFEEAFDPFLARVRPHPGQVRVTAMLTERLAGSARIRKSAADGQHLFKASTGSHGLPQDPYTLRCMPQMLGAVDDSLRHHGEVVTCELNSVTDNPIFDPATGRVVHGGNFFGQQVALVSDSFNQAMTVIAVLAERQLARLVDPALSPFPAFLQPHRPGLHSGLMGAQVTASSLVAHLRSLATPLAMQSMPTNGNNQDVNPMGTLAALRSHEILDRLFEILAILAIAVMQAHGLEQRRLGSSPSYSPQGDALARELATVIAPLEGDRSLSADISRMARHLDTPM
jgi:tyrosine ammonia-lyase